MRVRNAEDSDRCHQAQDDAFQHGFSAPFAVDHISVGRHGRFACSCRIQHVAQDATPKCLAQYIELRAGGANRHRRPLGVTHERNHRRPTGIRTGFDVRLGARDEPAPGQWHSVKPETGLPAWWRAAQPVDSRWARIAPQGRIGAFEPLTECHWAPGGPRPLRPTRDEWYREPSPRGRFTQSPARAYRKVTALRGIQGEGGSACRVFARRRNQWHSMSPSGGTDSRFAAARARPSRPLSFAPDGSFFAVARAPGAHGAPSA